MLFKQDKRRKAPLWAWIVIIIATLALLWFIISYSRLSEPVDRMPPTESPSGQNNTTP